MNSCCIARVWITLKIQFLEFTQLSAIRLLQKDSRGLIAGKIFFTIQVETRSRSKNLAMSSVPEKDRYVCSFFHQVGCVWAVGSWKRLFQWKPGARGAWSIYQSKEALFSVRDRTDHLSLQDSLASPNKVPAAWRDALTSVAVGHLNFIDLITKQCNCDLKLEHQPLNMRT